MRSMQDAHGPVCEFRPVTEAATISASKPGLAMCVGVPLVTVLTFSRLRNSQPIRAALLAVRTSNSVFPAYWFVAAALSALLVLSFASVPENALAAIVACLSALTTIYLAWRMTLLPALLAGEDISAEQPVDDRLRFNRSTVCMLYALAVQILAVCASLVSVVAFWLWTTLRRYRAVRLA